jgi:CheY-like chemotaxis protein
VPREKATHPFVEDQSDLRQMAEYLTLSGFDVIEAGNGVDAITHTTAQSPDVVLMDLSLPVMDGWKRRGASRTTRARRTSPSSR